MAHTTTSTPSPVPDLSRNRLPSLFEVLSRRTHAPVDLYSFYIYMRDQQRSVDYLDFWLDVAQHMSLCRHYVRELRRSVMIGTPPENEKTQSKRSSLLLDGLGDPPGPSEQTEKQKVHDAQMSAFLREESADNIHGHSPSNSLVSQNSAARNASSNERSKGKRRPSVLSNSPHDLTSNSNSPAHTVARADIRASAEKILYTFLLPGSEREVDLPQYITTEITRAIEEHGRDDPEVFDAAKDWVFQAMERDAFPGFLRMKALGNLVPPSLLLRLVVGLISLFAGLWTAFTLIFLGYSRLTRCWLILPFTIGVYLLATHQYRIDPIMGLTHWSEYTFMNFFKVKEPYIRYLNRKRSLVVLGVTVVISAALLCLFVFVPSHRL